MKRAAARRRRQDERKATRCTDLDDLNLIETNRQKLDRRHWSRDAWWWVLASLVGEIPRWQIPTRKTHRPSNA